MNAGAAMPYNIPKRVRKPRALKAPKEPKLPKEPKRPKITLSVQESMMPMITSLISPVERAAIKAGQAKLVAENQKSSASKIQRAFRGAIARKALKNTRADKAMNKAGDVLAGNTIARMIKAKVARDSAVKAPKASKAPKPKYKMSYAAALKTWNMSHNTGMYCNPRKGSAEYNAVQALRV